MAEMKNEYMRRYEVIFNYAGLMMLIVFYNLLRNSGWNVLLAAGLIFSLAVVIISFFTVHMNTGLWKLTHTKTQKLDEREIQVTHWALSLSYSLFTVLCLILFYVELIVLETSIGALEIACLIYFAHTLPSSVIAWKVKAE